MAIFETNFFSGTLGRFVDVTIINPSDTPPMFTKGNPYYQRPTKTLLLLHGYSGHRSDWLLGGHAREIATRYNFCVVLASAENKFYLNLPGTGNKYSDFFGVELPNFVHNAFHLSKEKEDNLVGGYSMGGFGALHVGLSHPDTFGGIVALSSALIVHQVAEMKPTDKPAQNVMADYDYYVTTFGDPEKVLTSKNNPEVLIEDLQKEGKPLPAIYMACGSEDFLIERNRAFDAWLTEKGVEHVFEEGPGIHNWDFWNVFIHPGIRYVLGEDITAGEPAETTETASEK